jgi:hypothetical protein
MISILESRFMTKSMTFQDVMAEWLTRYVIHPYLKEVLSAFPAALLLVRQFPRGECRVHR